VIGTKEKGEEKGGEVEGKDRRKVKGKMTRLWRWKRINFNRCDKDGKVSVAEKE
jgi:hypothetical protein